MTSNEKLFNFLNTVAQRTKVIDISSQNKYFIDMICET